jgi:gliding motility-associated-like protein
MNNRLQRHFIYIISFFLLIFLSGRLIAQTTNIASLPGPEGSLCPNDRFTVPVMVTSIDQVDSLLLIIHYPSGTLTYGSEFQHNPQLNSNGIFTVTNTNDTTVSIKWVATTPQTLSNAKILEITFFTGSENGYLHFDSTASYFRNSTGNIETIWQGSLFSYFTPLSVVIEEIDATCPESCDANLAAYVTGGQRPYNFLWQGEASVFDSVVAGACGGINNLRVTDANGCVLDTNFNVNVLPASQIEMVTDPDTVYLQNPVIHFSFTGDQDIVDWLWDFGDGSQGSREQAPVHLYSSAANPGIDKFIAVLHIVNESGCTDTVSVSIPVAEANLFIPNVFTPNNGDQINNFFKIAKNENDQKIPIDQEFIRMELVVFDRWGRKVYDNHDYRNDWDGDNLPQGTYYYRLDTFGYFKDESYKGAVSIIR